MELTMAAAFYILGIWRWCVICRHWLPHQKQLIASRLSIVCMLIFFLSGILTVSTFLWACWTFLDSISFQCYYLSCFFFFFSVFPWGRPIPVPLSRINVFSYVTSQNYSLLFWIKMFYNTKQKQLQKSEFFLFACESHGWCSLKS
jgi:hypothetical protein